MRKTLLLVVLALFNSVAVAQTAFPALGGDVSNGSGSLSYTVGQVETLYARGRVTNAETISASLHEGVQQTFLVNDLQVDGVAGIMANVYPNPTTEKIVIQVTSPQRDYTCILYTIDGQLLQQVTLSQELSELDMSSYSTGSYLLRLSKEGLESKYRIIKIR